MLLPGPATGLVKLDGIYRWAEARGYPDEDEHLMVEGLPTQFVPAPRSDPRDVAFPTVDLLQRIVLPLIARQRPLRSWERVWEIDP